MLTKKSLFFKNTFIFLIVIALAFGNVLVGQTQSELDWTNPVNISKSGISSNPVAVVDLRGVIHAIWIDEVDGYRYSQSADGVQWTAPVQVSFPFSVKDYAPLLLADANGSIHVFWITERQELFYSQTTPENFGNPSTWTTTRLGRNASNFDVIVDVHGSLHIAYISNATDELNTAGVYYRQSIIGGGFWSEAKPLYYSEYFRATTALNTNIKIAAVDQPAGQKIYITWDNRPRKQVFLATSVDAGKTWSGAQQFMGPNDTGQYGAPFNFSIWAGGDNILLLWQVGEPGASKCSVYSRASKDEGVTWGETILLFDGPTACPTNIHFVLQQNDKVAALLSGSGDPVLIAWNGSAWSEPQAQVALPSVANPETYDPVLLGCRQDLFYKNTLMVIGCDLGKGRDIWFLSRLLSPIDDWFSPPSQWSDPKVVEIAEQRASFISSVTDPAGNIHVVWVQTPILQDGSKPAILYSRWDGNEWLGPETIIQNLDGVPLQLTVYADSQNRLMLAWVDGGSGDLLFSWANLDQAHLSSAWVETIVLPSPSQLIGAPDIIVDATGRIVVAYAVKYNENRGVYIVHSTDNGASWSPYMKAFDSQQAQWDYVDNPKITLSGDGTLHLLFTRGALRGGETVGLYYSQSLDGGVNWTDPQIVGEGEISWSEITAYNTQTVHRLWQEDNGLVVANLSQESQDGGKTWGHVFDITNVAEQSSPVALATNGMGDMYLIQLVRNDTASFSNQEKITLKDWKWDGSQWGAGETRDLNIKGSGMNYLITAGLTSKNFLSVSLSAEYVDINRELRSTVFRLNRFIEDAGGLGARVSGIIPAPIFGEDGGTPVVSAPIPSPTPLENQSILVDSNDPSEGITKNLVGVALIGVVVLVAIVLLFRNASQKKTISGRRE